MMGTLILVMLVITLSLNFEVVVDSQKYLAHGLFIPTLGVVMVFIMFMETNRPPFDLSEAESDVVAGYNVEYGGILFALFYLGEYLSLFAVCTIFVFFLGGGGYMQSYYVFYFVRLFMFSLYEIFV
mmetsp:Transcript_22196/g.10628  ORF Transcript_22196/g.10628 Transcript_22196/m.10628 type:complete len:126 (+) Transcript_22196:709-1086(+)